MEEVNGITPPVLDSVVRSEGGDEMGARAASSSDSDLLKKPCKENDLLRAATESESKMLPDIVTHGQYHKIQKAVRFVNDNYRTDIRRHIVCELADMSPSHFSRIFRKVVGMSYQEYVNSMRITEAKELLSTSPRSVSEIAGYLGFADPTGFGRIFKKLTGHTPSAYRSLPENQPAKLSSAHSNLTKS
jgi:transcriptional regulator GlxA family with amidase domain